MTEEQLNAMSEKIIGCAFEVSNTLGCGFLEKPLTLIRAIR